MAGSRDIPCNKSGLTWHQVCLLRDATATLSVAEAEQFLQRVMRLLETWDCPPPRANNQAIVGAIKSVRAIEETRDPVKDAMNSIAEAAA